MLKLVAVIGLLVLVAAGCGGAGGPKPHGVPRALAHEWEDRASLIAAAAASGNDCRAMHLAQNLRADVLAAEHKLPVRLRSPLATGVTALAARTTCTPPPSVQSKPPKKPEPPPRHKHGHHKHDEGKHE